MILTNRKIIAYYWRLNTKKITTHCSISSTRYIRTHSSITSLISILYKWWRDDVIDMIRKSWRLLARSVFHHVRTVTKRGWPRKSKNKSQRCQVLMIILWINFFLCHFYGRLTNNFYIKTIPILLLLQKS